MRENIIWFRASATVVYFVAALSWTFTGDIKHGTMFLVTAFLLCPVWDGKESK